VAVLAAAQVIDGIPCYAPDIAESYDSYPAEGFDVTVQVEERSFWCRSRNRLLVQLLRRAVPSGRPQRMLEIGCGTGNVLSALRAIPELELIGSEVYLNGLRHARDRRPEITFIQLDATRMPFREEFDILGAFDVLEHIDDDERVMANVREALRPGGVFVVTVPQYQWMWSELDELVKHRRRYSRADLLGRLRRAGFEIVRCTSFVSTLFPAMAAVRLLSRGRSAAPSRDTRAAFARHVRLPGAANAMGDVVMRIDERLIAAGLSLPFGGSLAVVARRPPA
jgi:SAM-dependent methyltransferase